MRPVAKPRIVVVDPDPATLERMCGLLALEFDILAAVEAPRSAFAIIATSRPEVVILDLSLRSSTGLETAWRLSTLAKPPHVVFVTADEGRELVTAAEDAGALGYVLKRNLASDLIPALKRALRGRRMFPVLSLL
jgi:DNA-binding NarL/FixJ family response regulator